MARHLETEKRFELLAISVGQTPRCSGLGGRLTRDTFAWQLLQPFFITLMSLFGLMHLHCMITAPQEHLTIL